MFLIKSSRTFFHAFPGGVGFSFKREQADRRGGVARPVTSAMRFKAPISRRTRIIGIKLLINS